MRYFFKLKNKIAKKIKKITKRINAIPHKDVILFFLSIGIILAAKFIQFPSLTYNAEMFVENGTNFFIHAYRDSLLTNLMTLDAGYLPFIQRCVAVILVKGFHVISLYPLFSQLIALTFIAVMSSLINFNIFKHFSSSLAIRFILGIAIGLMSDYELNAFINFVYYGAILLFLAFFMNKEKMKNIFLFLLSLTTIFIILSKGQYIIFLPIYLILLYIHFRKKQIKSSIYYLCAIGAGALQFIILSINVPSPANSKLILFPYFVVKTIYYFVLTYRHVFFGYITKEGVQVFLVLFLIILFAVAIKKLLGKKDKKLLYIFLAGNFIALCSLFLTVVGLNNSVNPYIKNIVTTVKTSTSLTDASQNISQALTDDARTQKGIFDVKHFANLRSLFFSNLLIFLTGSLVLLTLLP